MLAPCGGPCVCSLNKSAVNMDNEMSTCWRGFFSWLGLVRLPGENAVITNQNCVLQLSRVSGAAGLTSVRMDQTVGLNSSHLPANSDIY